MSSQITRADLTHTFDACHKVEDEIMRQLSKRGITEDSPSWTVLPALERLSCPHWCVPDAWGYMLINIGYWASAHGSLAIWRAARTMKPIPFQRWLTQRRGKLEHSEEAKYLFADMDTIGDEELL